MFINAWRRDSGQAATFKKLVNYHKFIWPEAVDVLLKHKIDLVLFREPDRKPVCRLDISWIYRNDLVGEEKQLDWLLESVFWNSSLMTQCEQSVEE